MTTTATYEPALAADERSDAAWRAAVRAQQNALFWELDGALASLAEAIALDPTVAEWAFGEEAFAPLRDNEEFMRLTDTDREPPLARQAG